MNNENQNSNGNETPKPRQENQPANQPGNQPARENKPQQPKDNRSDNRKDSNQNSSREPSRQHQKDNRREGPRDNQRNQQNRDRRDFKKDAPRDSTPKDSNRDSNRDSNKDSNREPRKDSNRDSNREPRKDAPRENQRDNQRDSRGRDSNRDSNRDSRKDFPKDKQRGERRDSQRDNRRDSRKDFPEDRNKESAKGVHTDSRKEPLKEPSRYSNVDLQRETIEETNKEIRKEDHKEEHKEAHKETDKEISKETTNEAAKETETETPKDVNKEAAKEVSKETKENTKEGKQEPQGFQVLPYDFDAQFRDKHKKNLYSDARSIAVKIITKCERTDSYLDKLIDFELRNETLNDFDKALLNELAHGVIRWMRRLDWFLNGFYRGNYEKCQPEVRNAMRVALYQIMFLNKIPYSAAVNEAVEFVKRLHGDKHAGVVNGLLRTIIRTLENLVWPTRDVDEVNYLGMVQSHPNWMVKRWVQRFGFDEAEKFCEFNNKRPILGLRINRMRSNIDEVETYLNNKGIVTRRGANIDYFLTIKSMGRIYTDEFFKKGFFSVQDESAGLVSTLLDPQKEDLVIDMCAAPGGKTMHISELMNNEGKIIAIEKYGSRAKALKNNLERTNVTNAQVVHDSILEPETALLKEELIGKADKILIDAPCSGLGVITKKPDIKLKRELEDIQKLQKLQIELINGAVKYLKPGGVIVYSTCTTEPEENFEVIKAFLEKNPDFKIDNAERFVKNKKIVNAEGFIETFPFRNYLDGSFAIRLVRDK